MNVYRCNYRLTIDKTINTVIVITIYIYTRDITIDAAMEINVYR
jgi:hypothetical protein